MTEGEVPAGPPHGPSAAAKATNGAATHPAHLTNGPAIGRSQRVLNIGVMEILMETEPPKGAGALYATRFRRLLASITPQVVSVWCRRLGHRVTYANYYGQSDMRGLLPKDLDVVFISTYTQASPMAYALARLLRQEGVVTVLGGPHARAFPRDSLRFFDYVVLNCDEQLVADILRQRFTPPAVVSAKSNVPDFPTVEERMPEIEAAYFTRGRPAKMTMIPLLGSVGCPYTCNFCVDWKNAYVLLPLDKLEADLAFMSRRLPGVMAAFCDPNFGVKFDEVLNVFERLPPSQRPPYVMESSLSIVKGERLKRLKETNCVYVAPGVESWNDYSNKADAGASTGREKLEKVVRRFQDLHEYVPGLQANFVFGVDVDAGREPAELTMEFVRRLPYVYPTVNIPTPFGDTPMFDRYLAEGRTLRQMPFAFYYQPWPVTTFKHYTVPEYLDLLIEINEAMGGWRMLADRWMTRLPLTLKLLMSVRTIAIRQDLAEYRSLKQRFLEDAGFRSFHEGKPGPLPEYYHRLFEKRLGKYAAYLPREDRTPVLEAMAPTAVTVG